MLLPYSESSIDILFYQPSISLPPNDEEPPPLGLEPPLDGLFPLSGVVTDVLSEVEGAEAFCPSTSRL